jgi:1-aminocyclopropane-1-carboxylate deaminase/D-cysteine desulfhydrase-like pyridoxal-dependent ACC family enzyme
MAWRDDLFEFAGIYGTKVRGCLAILEDRRRETVKGLVTGGSRSSPQVAIVARVAAARGLPCHVFCPCGEYGPQMLDAAAHGATIEQRKGGYANNLARWATVHAKANPGWLEIPYGMQHPLPVQATERMANSVLAVHTPSRIVVPVGSGTTFAGVLRAARRYGVPVVGVRVGGDPVKNISRWCPMWQTLGGAALVDGVDLEGRLVGYDTHVSATVLGSLWPGYIELDPVYEAKCVAWLLPGDLFWIVGKRAV